jgi:hypothetical protein
LPLPATRIAGRRLAAGRGAAATACLAAYTTTEGNIFIDSSCGLFERQRHVTADVGAAANTPSTPAAPSAASEQITEHATAEEISECLENILDIIELVYAINPCVPITIIPVTFLGVAEHLVSFGGFLESLDRVLIITVAVGMVLDGEFTISAIDLCFGSGPLDLQHFVIAGLFGHDGLPC